MNDIQQIKEKFGQEAELIIANGLQLEKRGNKYRCPNGIAHKNNDRTPSMSWDPNALQFYCFGCGLKIDIYGYYKDHLNYIHNEIVRELLDGKDYKSNQMEKNRATFQVEIKKIEPLSDECMKYIKLRGITVETAKFFELATYKGQIAFPYFRGDTIIGYKLRKPMKNPHPKMTSITGSKPFLFNSKNIEPGGDELIICEGEFDCMIIWQCGIKNVVSVGAGANSLKSLLEQAKEFLDSFQYLIIVSDNDEAGDNMDKLFVEQYGEKVKLIDKRLYARNDINEEYVLKGPDSVRKIIESARWKIEGRWDLDEKPYEGLMTNPGKFIPTGIETIDYAINDLAPGCVTLITGRTNEGKTTFTKQIIANAINLGNKVYVISGEGDSVKFINEIYQLVIGRNPAYYKSVKVNKKWHKEPKKDVLKALQQWHKGKLVMFNKGESKLKTLDELFSMIEYEIKLKKYDLVVIDNLMSVLTAKAVEKLEKQAEFVQRCNDLAKVYRNHIILVLHPNKTYVKGEDMEVEQISGNMDMPNKADNVIHVRREYDESKIAQGINGKISVLKNRYYSDLVSCKVYFDKETGQLAEIKDDGYVLYEFDWEKYLPHQQQLPDWEEVEDEHCPF